MTDTTNGRVYLPTSSGCFVCGDENPAGLKTRFYVEDGAVKATLTPTSHHCGYRNVVHGGIVAAIIDECMGWAAARAIARMCVTAELSIRYLRNVPGDRVTTVVTGVERAHRRMVETRAALMDDAGAEYARGEGKFTPLTIEQTLAVDGELRYRGDEERVFDALRFS